MFHHNTLDGDLLAGMLRTAHLLSPLTSPWLLDEEKTMNLSDGNSPVLWQNPEGEIIKLIEMSALKVQFY